AAVACREADQVREVQLTLRVARTQLPEQGKEDFRANGVETGVAFRDRALRRGGVALFDDADDLAPGTTENSAIARRACKASGQERQVGGGRAMGVHQRA